MKAESRKNSVRTVFADVSTNGLACCDEEKKRKKEMQIDLITWLIIEATSHTMPLVTTTYGTLLRVELKLLMVFNGLFTLENIARGGVLK